MFKEGDKLICINAKNIRLELNSMYTFCHYSLNDSELFIKEHGGVSFYTRRFILATPLIEALL